MQLSQTEKQRARAVLSDMRNRLSDTDVTQKSREICRIALKEILLSRADRILLFSPIKKEPDILPLASQLLDMGKHVYFPISHKTDVRLDFREVNALSDLTVGAYGIKEPRPDSQAFLNSDFAVCIVPALSFDRRGMRIGYGKGYYDRFLSTFKGKSIGVVFSELISESIPTDAYDVPVDIIITEGGVILPNEAEKAIKR